jgi:predicted nucleic acid-binding Zn ribbon protein
MEKFKRKSNCECMECGKAIYRRPSKLKQGEVFCSTKCSNVRHKKGDIICPVCSTVVPRSKRAKTCSRKCANVQRTGISYNIGRPRDKCAKIRTIRAELIAERGGKCNRCTYSKVEILQLHHILERANGGGDEASNLELLCPNCHTEHHFSNGTKMEG